jgi:methylenetetrahydrofolate dehydrogenase (NADP+)/methenyltetrahydrofolate cyclohydrolase
LLKKIKELNEDDNIDGFIVNYRFRNKLMKKVLMAVNPSKDVDGFHPILEKWLWI